VNGAGDNFLAGSCFAKDHHFGIAAGGHRNLLSQISGCGAIPKEDGFGSVHVGFRRQRKRHRLNRCVPAVR
jgi:hypothetical protein